MREQELAAESSDSNYDASIFEDGDSSSDGGQDNKKPNYMDVS